MRPFKFLNKERGLGKHQEGEERMLRAGKTHSPPLFSVGPTAQTCPQAQAQCPLPWGRCQGFSHLFSKFNYMKEEKEEGCTGEF